MKIDEEFIKEQFRSQFEPFIDGLIAQLPLKKSAVNLGELSSRKYHEQERICIQIAKQINLKPDTWFQVGLDQISSLLYLKSITSEAYEELDVKLQEAIDALP
ncbi:MAG: hypothetical protein JJ975_01525 [Bacteroidia bacterium]|nr:hypothetical protein [Bacteroidia bacterium]